jgi:hypothetical protein
VQLAAAIKAEFGIVTGDDLVLFADRTDIQWGDARLGRRQPGRVKGLDGTPDRFSSGSSKSGRLFRWATAPERHLPRLIDRMAVVTVLE